MRTTNPISGLSSRFRPEIRAIITGPELHIQAFADDLALLIGGRAARELENKTNLILADISDKLEDLELKLSIDKCRWWCIGASPPKSFQKGILQSLIESQLSRSKTTQSSGHGPFPSYLHRFKFLDSPHCIFGMLGDADHYIFSCSLNKEFHLIKPADEHKKAWFYNLLTNRQAVTKMEGDFRTSRNICETLTKERGHN
ncbi:hypothetical protein AVEN_273940-1 [Araneus ventricosus]|uniref:Reverse transcriptase domain-containing protein n=1 Tax=Araneus ventricosus TaxID=182803 RepID=A0A4Y2HN07_ARAVE|nr:hypothetical protein AVEN_273940-1 [Araneus ventricosus]